MRVAQIGAKYNFNTIPVKNAEASVSIGSGVPVCFVYNGTDDGLAVVLPATATGVKATSFFAGILEIPGSQTLAVGVVGSAICNGLCTNAKITLQTRATSTDSFNSWAALSVGQVLQIDTVGNGLTQGATVGASNVMPAIVCAQTLASGASSASTTANTATSVTAGIKVHVRTM